AVANTLSLGWQLGFIREFGGGALDLGKAMVTKGGVKGKASSGLLDRPMFSMFYMTQALGYGGLLTYAMTGKTPSGLMDYIYPRTGETDDQGNPMRVSTMFYTKEIASLYKHIENEGVLSAVGDIAMSKAAGQIGLIEEWARGLTTMARRSGTLTLPRTSNSSKRSTARSSTSSLSRSVIKGLSQEKTRDYQFLGSIPLLSTRQRLKARRLSLRSMINITLQKRHPLRLLNGARMPKNLERSTHLTTRISSMISSRPCRTSTICLAL